MAGSIRRQGTNSWSIMVELLPDPITKKRRRRWLTVHGSKKDAERARTEALSQRDQGVDLAPSKTTLAEFLERWLADVIQHKARKSTVVGYRGIVRSQIVPAIGHIRLADLRPLHIQAAYSRWLEPGHRADGHSGVLSKRTVLHYHTLLKAALDQAVKWQLIPRNPCNSVDSPRPERTEMGALDEVETRRLLDAASDEPLNALFYLAVTTGARLGELLALHWEDIDMTQRRLTIAWTVRRFAGEGYVFGRPKTHRSRRSVALDVETVRVLQEHRRRQLQDRLLVGPAYGDKGLVFATALGHVLADSTVRTTFNRVLRKAGLRRIRIHDLRHTAATLMLKAGISPKLVSDRLGHSNIAITLDTYSHVMPDMQHDAAEALARVIG
jgi:integrase